MATQTRFDVFLSFCREDVRHARVLYEELAPSCSVFFSDRTLEHGASLDRTISAAIESARIFASIVSTYAPQSRWWRDELSYQRDFDRVFPGRSRLLPVLLEPVRPLPIGISDSNAVKLWEVGGHQMLARAILEFACGAGAEPPPPAGLARYPTGPRVEPADIPADLTDAYVDLVGTSERLRQLVAKAAEMVRDVDPAARFVKWEQIDVGAGDGADSEVVLEIWRRAVRLACLHGPRMVAALLELVPAEELPVPTQLLRERTLTRLLGYWRLGGPEAGGAGAAHQT